jgi:hypothetical protein
MNKFLVFMACAMVIFAFVHVAHAGDDFENEDGMCDLFLYSIISFVFH